MEINVGYFLIKNDDARNFDRACLSRHGPWCYILNQFRQRW